MTETPAADASVMDDEASDHKGWNGVPVIERALDILFILEKQLTGANIRDLTQQLQIPRSTVYRILNTLAERDIVRRQSNGAYQLGPGLTTLAAQVRIGAKTYDLVALTHSHARKLAEKTGEANKLSVRDGRFVRVIATTAATRDYGLAPTLGMSLPLHAGAASKMVMAHLDESDLDEYLAKPLESYTSRTMLDPNRLRLELARIRQQGWSQDKGEHRPNVHAFAAPIFEPSGLFVAALSVPFLSDKDNDSLELLRQAVIDAAAAISADIPK